MSQGAAIAATLVAYKVIMLAVGVYAQRRTGDTDDFFVGGRNLGPLVAAISASASSSSAWTLLGVSGASYRWGLGALWLLPGCIGGFCLAWFALAPTLNRLSHRTRAMTTTDVLADGGSANDAASTRHIIRWCAALIIVLSLIVYVASQFQAAGKTFNQTFGLSLPLSIGIGAAIVALYTLLGGFWAVSLTDTLQGLLMALAAVALPIVALLRVGGFGALAAGLAAVKVPGYLGLSANKTGMAGAGFIASLVGISLGYVGQPHVVNRFMALHDQPRALRSARRIAISWALLVYPGMLLLGLCGRVLAPSLADGEAILIVLSRSLFGPVLAGVVLAAVLSAIMSTADSQLLVATSAISHDTRLGGDSSQRGSLTGARLTMLGLSAASTVAAIYGPRRIFARVLFAWSALGNAFGPALLRIARRPERPPSASAVLVAMVLGFVLSVVAHLVPFSKGTVFERVVPFFVGLGVVYLRRP